MVDIPEKYKKYIGLKDLNKLPDNLKRYKCMICYSAGFDTPTCPECGNTETIVMCVLDHCNCHHDIIEKLEYCPICEQAICPECGSHDVEQISRITGYLNAVSGFNAGKAQELKDRHRENIATQRDNADV